MPKLNQTKEMGLADYLELQERAPSAHIHDVVEFFWSNSGDPSPSFVAHMRKSSEHRATWVADMVSVLKSESLCDDFFQKTGKMIRFGDLTATASAVVEGLMQKTPTLQ